MYILYFFYISTLLGNVKQLTKDTWFFFLVSFHSKYRININSTSHNHLHYMSKISCIFPSTLFLLLSAKNLTEYKGISWHLKETLCKINQSRSNSLLLNKKWHTKTNGFIWLVFIHEDIWQYLFMLLIKGFYSFLLTLKYVYLMFINELISNSESIVLTLFLYVQFKIIKINFATRIALPFFIGINRNC